MKLLIMLLTKTVAHVRLTRKQSEIMDKARHKEQLSYLLVGM